jgi:hypothetical protein
MGPIELIEFSSPKSLNSNLNISIPQFIPFRIKRSATTDRKGRAFGIFPKNKSPLKVGGKGGSSDAPEGSLVIKTPMSPGLLASIIYMMQCTWILVEHQELNRMDRLKSH